jgi:hypothetical protein
MSTVVNRAARGAWTSFPALSTGVNISVDIASTTSPVIHSSPSHFRSFATRPPDPHLLIPFRDTRARLHLNVQVILRSHDATQSRVRGQSLRGVCYSRSPRFLGVSHFVLVLRGARCRTLRFSARCCAEHTATN